MATAARRRRPTNYRSLARRYAKRYGLDPDIFERQIDAESGFNPRAGSPAGAQGIAQIMPGTARSWGVDPYNPAQSLNAAAKNMARYVKEFGSYEKALRAYNAGPGAVERSRGYAETNNYVRKILRGEDPGGLGRSTGGGGVLRTPATVQRDQVTPGGTGVAGLLRELREQQKLEAMPASQGVAAPAFSAQAVLPEGFQPVESGAPAVKDDSLERLLSQVSGLRGEGVPRSTVTPGSVTGSGGATSGEVAIPQGGRVVGRPKDRPGVPTSKHTLELVRRASAWGGIPIQLGTGSQHSQFTANGNVSDHWGGKALDLPATGRQGDRIAGALLVQLGVPRKKARKMARSGGIFNINRNGRRWQVIWRAPDHFDHVHVGYGKA